MTTSTFYNLVYFSTATTGTGTITVGSAVGGARTPATASIPTGTKVSYSILDGSNYEVGQGTYTVSGTTLSRDTVYASSNSNSAISLSGSALVSLSILAEDFSTISQLGSVSGRVTLSSGVPVMTSDVTGATTVYFTPFRGNQIPVTVNGGTTYPFRTFTELSQTTTDTTKSPAAVAASKVYDILVWDDAGTLRATRSVAWSSDTSRGTGAGTAELQLSNGFYVNKVAVTNGPAAKCGTYVGSIRSNGSSQIDWKLGGASSGGTAPFLYVWNYYNRVSIQAQTIDTASSTPYTYTSATIQQANASSGNQINFLSGLAEDSPTASLDYSLRTTGNVNSNCFAGIALDSTGGSTTIPTPHRYAICFTVAAVTLHGRGVVSWNVPPQLGVHFLASVQWSDGTHANTFNDNSGVGGGDNLEISFLM